jgi:hypothetical protein
MPEVGEKLIVKPGQRIAEQTEILLNSMVFGQGGFGICGRFVIFR